MEKIVKMKDYDMKKLISSIVIVAALAAPISASAAPAPTAETKSETALILLGMIGLVVLAPQLGLGATRNGHDLSISPLDVDTDLGLDVAD